MSQPFNQLTNSWTDGWMDWAKRKTCSPQFWATMVIVNLPLKEKGRPKGPVRKSLITRTWMSFQSFLKIQISVAHLYMCSTFQSYSMYIIALYSKVLVYSFWWAGDELPQCPRRVRSKHLVQRPRFETLFSIVSFLKNASDIKVWPSSKWTVRQRTETREQ